MGSLKGVIGACAHYAKEYPLQIVQGAFCIALSSQKKSQFPCDVQFLSEQKINTLLGGSYISEALYQSLCLFSKTREEGLGVFLTNQAAFQSLFAIGRGATLGYQMIGIALSNQSNTLAVLIGRCLNSCLTYLEWQNAQNKKQPLRQRIFSLISTSAGIIHDSVICSRKITQTTMCPWIETVLLTIHLAAHALGHIIRDNDQSNFLRPYFKGIERGALLFSSPMRSFLSIRGLLRPINLIPQLNSNLSPVCRALSINIKLLGIPKLFEELNFYYTKQNNVYELQQKKNVSRVTWFCVFQGCLKIFKRSISLWLFYQEEFKVGSLAFPRYRFLYHIRKVSAITLELMRAAQCIKNLWELYVHSKQSELINVQLQGNWIVLTQSIIKIALDGLTFVQICGDVKKQYKIALSLLYTGATLGSHIQKYSIIQVKKVLELPSL